VKIFGLTGGIATGKSTVAQLLVARGAALIDADVVARQVVEPGSPALAELAQRFPGVLKPDGALDRAALGQRIFHDAAAREAVNAITHPRIQAAVLEQTLRLQAQGEPLVIYDAALLIENRLHEAMNGVILVVAPPEVQRARLMARNGLSEAEAQARIDSQLPLDRKRAHATWIIDNGGTREATAQQVEVLWQQLQRALGSSPP
jgi:dephospho-CoA kinase